MPCELKRTSKPSAPAAFGSQRSPPSGRQSPQCGEAQALRRNGCWTLVVLLVALVSAMVVVLHSWLDVGRALLLDAPPSL